MNELVPTLFSIAVVLATLFIMHRAQKESTRRRQLERELEDVKGTLVRERLGFAQERQLEGAEFESLRDENAFLKKELRQYVELLEKSQSAERRALDALLYAARGYAPTLANQEEDAGFERVWTVGDDEEEADIEAEREAAAARKRTEEAAARKDVFDSELDRLIG